MGDERASRSICSWRASKRSRYLIDCKAGYSPQDFAQEVYDRAHVVEDRLQRLLAQVDHNETCRCGTGGGPFGAPRLARLLGAHHKLVQFAIGSCTHLL